MLLTAISFVFYFWLIGYLITCAIALWPMGSQCLLKSLNWPKFWAEILELADPLEDKAVLVLPVVLLALCVILSVVMTILLPLKI